MAEPQDNAPPGFTSPWGPQYGQQYGPFTPIPAGTVLVAPLLLQPSSTASALRPAATSAQLSQAPTTARLAQALA